MDGTTLAILGTSGAVILLVIAVAFSRPLRLRRRGEAAASSGGIWYAAGDGADCGSADGGSCGGGGD